MSDSFDGGEDIFGFLSSEKDIELTKEDGSATDWKSQTFAGPSKDAVLFCIDCSRLGRIMDASDGCSRYQEALTAMHSFMRNKVVASDGSDMTGLVFYNVSTAQNPLRTRRINLVQPLGTLSARSIEQVGELSRLSTSDFCQQFGDPTSDADISDLLFVCNAQFKKISASYRARMFIFTSEDEPCGSDRKAKKAAQTRAQDFHEGMSEGAEINLIPFILDASSKFDVRKFWEPILLLSGGEDEDRNERFVSNSVLQLSDMKEISLKKLFKKRPVNRLNFFLSSSCKVALMMYTSYYAAGKPKRMFVDPSTMHPLRSDTIWVSEFSGAVTVDMETYVVSTQGEQVPLRKEDLVTIRDFSSLEKSGNDNISGSLHLVGFRPASFLLPEYSVGHSCFLYPQDERIEGSSLVVSALINRLHAKNLIAIARAVPKANSSLQLVALVPQPELLDPETGRQEKSPGLFVVRLPFADDLRDLTLRETNLGFLMNKHPQEIELRKKQVESAKRVVDALTEPHWEPDMLDNPALKVCYTGIEAIALSIPADQTVEVEDLLHPDPRKVEIAESLASQWLSSMHGIDTSACAASGSVVAKKIKTEEKKIWTETDVTQGRKEELLISKIKLNID